MSTCSRCQTSVQPAWKVCPVCGNDLAVATPKSCAGCGEEVQPGWRNCPACGEALGHSAPPAGDLSFSDQPGTVMRTPGQAAPKPAAASIGDSSRYRIEGELGRGGMGVVYRAVDTVLGRTIALKRLLGEAARDQQAVERFLTEARAVAALNHPNVLTVFDTGTDDQGPFIAMELVEGAPLDDLQKQAGGRFPEARAVALFRGICAGIDYAHRRQVIHRDIKPGNILVTHDDVPKVADFGLARLGTGSNLSMSGYGMGTMDYAAPEQKKDAKSADHRADIYSLGCTFYEMLTGHRPPPHPEEVPDRWRDLVLKSTHPDPARRPFSVSEVLATLDRAGKPAGETGRQKQAAGTARPKDAVREPARERSAGWQPPAPPKPKPAAPPARPRVVNVLSNRPVPMIVILSIITLGIYGLIAFFQSGAEYETAAGRASSFRGKFWGYFFLAIVGSFSLAAGVGLLFLLFAVIVGAQCLGEVWQLREEAMNRAGVRLSVSSKGSHVGMWVGGFLLSFLGIGLILLIVQAVIFFSEHNRVATALRHGGDPSAAF